MRKVFLLALSISIFSLCCHPVVEYVKGTTDVVLRIYLTDGPWEIATKVPTNQVSTGMIDRYFEEEDGIYKIRFDKVQVRRDREWVYIRVTGVSPITGEYYEYQDDFIISPFNDFLLDNYEQDNVTLHLIIY